MFDQLANIDTSRTTWRIKVRVTRMWPSASSSSSGPDSLKGYNMLLLDDDNCHVHAFVYADNWRSISNNIVEGGLYIISNFYTKEAMASLRPTSSKMIINFSNSTTVEKLETDDFMIPMNKFEFTDLGDLFSVVSGYENADSPPLATDIIGVLEDFESAKNIQTMFGQRKIARFRITDGRYSHKVSVWGHLAVTTTEAYKKISERPIVVIVTSSKLKIFKSSVQVSTLPSSKIYLNLESDYVDEMRLRLEEEGYKVPESNESTPIQTPVIPTETITLKELGEKTNADDIKRNFLCAVEVNNVEETGNWWYLSCTACQYEVTKMEGKYKCPKCPKCIPIAEKRFKVVVLAGDSTEAFNFILSDRAVKRIVGQTATKMIYDHYKNSTTGYPTKIKEIAKKELIFNVEISEDNVELKSKIFFVTDAYDKSYFIASHSGPQGPMGGGSESVYSENTIDLSKSGHTPESAKSVCKKIKMEN